MTDQQKPASPINRALPFVVACILIASFLYRVFTAAHELPMRSEQVMTMIIDFCLIVGLCGMRSRMPAALFWCALAAGIGLFLIRLNSDDSWWTGHIMYSIPPR
jgi:hypothetical protein